MSLSASQVFLYGADPTDYANAENIASNHQIPFGNVTGSFAAAWAAAASGKFLVIAVGGPANDALYYNPCGWAGLPSGSTPFHQVASPPIAALPGANYYENAAGNTATDSLEIATDYVEYALGQGLSYNPIPTVYAPSDTCEGTNPTYG